MCLKDRVALWTIFVISIAGLLFSGYLSFSELMMRTCPLGNCSNVLGLPACVYGFIMYLAIFIISLIGLEKKNDKPEYSDKVKIFLKYSKI